MGMLLMEGVADLYLPGKKSLPSEISQTLREVQSLFFISENTLFPYL